MQMASDLRRGLLLKCSSFLLVLCILCREIDFNFHYVMFVNWILLGIDQSFPEAPIVETAIC